MVLAGLALGLIGLMDCHCDAMNLTKNYISSNYVQLVKIEARTPHDNVVDIQLEVVMDIKKPLVSGQPKSNFVMRFSSDECECKASTGENYALVFFDESGVLVDTIGDSCRQFYELGGNLNDPAIDHMINLSKQVDSDDLAALIEAEMIAP
ncbi:hypothetical protein [uncultured Umboniibacter sp.]|uniref:hypothetical protein n=1 Tax=uncultured Umboniibacter sp. TaxID=1798917 RepID=UPI00261A5F69|nr:hypothetical protein [uncultured Umboniibacter sp.]